MQLQSTAAFSLTRSFTARLAKTPKSLKMVGDVDINHLHSMALDFPHWVQFAQQGIADAAASSGSPVCPGFGEPGWAPFCFLNGNPVFKAFDVFQEYVQNSVVSLHDGLEGLGVKNAYGPSIMMFTVFVRFLLFPLSFRQLASSQKTQSLQPKLQEIKEKFPDKEVQNQMIALLYQETEVNPLAGCLPSLFQLPVFVALYRSFYNLASQNKIDESFLWLPNLSGPVYGTRSTDWLFKDWHNNIPSLGWHDTLAYLTIPLFLFIAQSVSLRILTPPSDDPTVEKTQRILKYLPLMIAYFSLSVPAGLGVYWITNNILSTVTTAGIKEYFKRNPIEAATIDLDKLANSQNSVYMNPAWGYTSEAQIIEEAKLNYRPSRRPLIPSDFQ